MRNRSAARFAVMAVLVGVIVSWNIRSLAQAQQPTQSDAQNAENLQQKLQELQQLPDDQRARETKQLAQSIRKIVQPTIRLGLATSLANLPVDGDFGQDTLQAVATTLSEALRGLPGYSNPEPYGTLAELVRFEHVTVSLNAPLFKTALKQLADDDQKRERADFTLTDLNGTSWRLKALRGKVVLVNFWETSCLPCRREMPDLNALHSRYKDSGLVILGISDEDVAKVQPFVAEQGISYPVLIDIGRKVNERFLIQRIPRTLLYDRNGKLAAEAVNMRTRKQLQALLTQAGLKLAEEVDPASLQR